MLQFIAYVGSGSSWGSLLDHQRHIHLRALIDQKVSLQGTAFVARESARGGLDFKQAGFVLARRMSRMALTSAVLPVPAPPVTQSSDPK